MAQSKTQSKTQSRKMKQPQNGWNDDNLAFNDYNELIYDDFNIGRVNKKNIDGQSVSKHRKQKMRIQHEEELKQASKIQKVVQKILATQLPLNNMSEEEKIVAVEEVHQIKPTANEMRLFTKDRRHARQTKAAKYNSDDY